MVCVELDYKCTYLTNWFSIGLNFLYKKDSILDGIQSDLLKNTYVCLTKEMRKSSMIPSMAIKYNRLLQKASVQVHFLLTNMTLKLVCRAPKSSLSVVEIQRGM